MSWRARVNAAEVNASTFASKAAYSLLMPGRVAHAARYVHGRARAYAMAFSSTALTILTKSATRFVARSAAPRGGAASERLLRLESAELDLRPRSRQPKSAERDRSWRASSAALCCTVRSHPRVAAQYLRAFQAGGCAPL